LEHLLARALLETIFEITLNTLPHILTLLIAVLPARLKYAALLIGASVLECWGDLLAIAILVLTDRIFGSDGSSHPRPLRLSLLDPARGVWARSPAGRSSHGAWNIERHTMQHRVFRARSTTVLGGMGFIQERRWRHLTMVYSH
jgi:hypothetical protein